MSQTPQRRPYVSRTASFASGADSPVRVLEECLAEIDRREAAVGAFTLIDAAAARAAAVAAAERWRADRPLSVIDGMPVGVKDMIDTADMVTGMGSPLFDGYRPRFDAASVQGLREAGAVILGKTVTTEFASTHPRGTRNPWDLTRTPGGSSSGSAAAACCAVASARRWWAPSCGPRASAGHMGSSPRWAGSTAAAAWTTSARASPAARSLRASRMPGQWPAHSPM